MQPSNRVKLEERARVALGALYHAASPAYPQDFGPYADDFEQWLGFQGSMAIRDFNESDAEIVAMFGPVYSHGRSGRTLAPEGLVKEKGGGAFALNLDSLFGLNTAELTRAVKLVEDFGERVRVWNVDVPYQWAEETACRAEFDRNEARHILTNAREALRAIFADMRKVRAAGVETPAVCQALAQNVRGVRREMRAAFATLVKLAGVGVGEAVAA